MLTQLHYRALDCSSSALLIQRLEEANEANADYVDLYERGQAVLVPTWAVVCALAEREEDDSLK